MKSADRAFNAAVGIQFIHLLSLLVPGVPSLVTECLSWIWLAFAPAIGFLNGREGNSPGKSGGHAALLLVTWFFMGALSEVIFPSVKNTEIWLTGIAGFALSCFLFAVVAFIVAAVAALVGRRFCVDSPA